MVISELISTIKGRLLENAEFEAKEIVMYALNLSRNELILNPKREVTDSEMQRVDELVRRRLSGEPLQYILGFSEFMSLKFSVNSHTLIPRSDTETLVELLIEKIGSKKCSLLDIGTGTGCIGISLAKYSGADVTLADISKEALKIATENAEQNGVTIKTLNIDILNEIPQDKYDIVVSNPPYIRSNVIPTLQTEVKEFEPLSALDGGDDGLIFYKRITEIAPNILNNGGILAYEIGFDQGDEVKALMEKDFCDVEVIKDLCGNDRVVIGIKKG